ncbi:major facilitator superfamily domain-containing protein [Emericellopsis cladophorae]|uniref:Major facilitator superfamily domain-containing protein n=1 Tax=Emericellopsis cladophorae TaxID=2686198 RepID=A0A9P9Y9A7_9HYPO|nr:major facilitator superfamily domain-containing protein [Emericellopsis cladophorae]KAI6785468.1 major facilitator superfamily domain-containing protein [Emericellopsis cladophorae]
MLTVFATLSIALLIYVIDHYGIATTLPIIASDLNGKNTISEAGTSALLANTTFQMLYGIEIYANPVVMVRLLLTPMNSP